MTGLPAGWAQASISDVIAPFNTIDPRKTPDMEFRYIDISAIDNSRQVITDIKFLLGKDAPSRARRVVKAGDVLFSTVRTYLKNIALVPEYLDGCLTSTGVAVLRPSEAINEKYLFWWVCSEPFISAMSQAQDGTMYPAISDKDVYRGSIAVPPLNEQRRIVAKLDSLFERTRRAREELTHIPRLIENYKKAILDTAFRGESNASVGEPDQTDDMCSLSSALDELRTGPFGSTLHKSDYRVGGIPVINPKHIVDGKIFPENEVAVSSETLERLSEFQIGCGDVVIARRGVMGRCAVVTEQEEGWVCGTGSMILRPSVALDSDYLQLFLSAPQSVQALEQASVGSTMANLNQQALLTLKIWLPPLQRQRDTVARVREAWAWLGAVAIESVSARRLLDLLDEAVLAKAFRGELVPQDPNDEPASVLLERIAEVRKGSPKVKRSRTGGSNELGE